MRLERLPLGREGAVHMNALLQQRVEHRHQRRLVIVPSQAELLVVVHSRATRRALGPTSKHSPSTTFKHHAIIRPLGNCSRSQ